MKVLIVSDTHKIHTNFNRVMENIGYIDMLIHLGDVEGREDELREQVGCPVHMIAGNNDFFSELPREEEFFIGEYHVFIAHGHNYYVSMGDERIKEEARGRDVDIVMYGHTHRPVLAVEEDLVTLNPGSLSYPRQTGRHPSYIIMEIDEKGKAEFTINYV